MTDEQIREEFRRIHEKLDFITDQMKQAQQRQKEMQAFKDDLTRIGKDIFQAAVEELEDVAPYFNTTDLVHLLKKLLRNVRNINTMLDQMESTRDFLKDALPIGKMAFTDLLQKLDDLDRKGFFQFSKEAVGILDTIVTTFTVEDVRLLRKNITSILMTVKSMTQPDILHTMENAMGFYRKMDISVEDKITYRNLIRELRKPEVKRGLAFLLQFVQNMANQNGSNPASSDVSGENKNQSGEMNHVS